MATYLAASTWPLTLSAMNKLTIRRGGTNRSFYFSRNMPNLLPGCSMQIHENTKAHLRNNNDHVDVEKVDKIAEPNIEGLLLENGLLFQQEYTRSFEIGSDSKISIEALMNYFQDSSLNHLKSIGLHADGFGSSKEMIAKDLIWVIYWSNMEVDSYPSWSDVVQVYTWLYKSRRIGFHRGWHVRDIKTGKILIKATSLYVMMNKKTRKFAGMGEEFSKLYLKHYYNIDIIDKDRRKLPRLDTDEADYARTGLNSLWTDVDINQHVNHSKVVKYALESVPRVVVESHEISAITLEYKKECKRDYVLQSFSKVIKNRNNGISNLSMDNGEIEFDHLLCTECGQEIVRARTMWKPKKQTTQDRKFTI